MGNRVDERFELFIGEFQLIVPVNGKSRLLLRKYNMEIGIEK